MVKAFALGAVTSLAILGGSALAADLPVKTAPYRAPAPLPYNWSGFYVGGNLGWGWNSDNGQQLCTDPAGASFGPGCIIVSDPSIDADGFIGGGQIGYNWQVNNWVFGVEADIQGADINGSANIAGPFPQVGGGNSGNSSWVANETLDWFGTVRGRVGFAWDRALLYATGGLAYGHESVDLTFTGFGAQWPSSASDTKTGWTLGGGVEYAYVDNWTVKIEGLYYDLGTITSSGVGIPPNGYTAGKEFEFKGGIVRVGLNYKFY